MKSLAASAAVLALLCSASALAGDNQPKTDMFAVAAGALVTAAGTRVEFSSDGADVTILNFEKLSLADAAYAACCRGAGSRRSSSSAKMASFDST
ncbi:hypothetical protein [Pseudoduganella sp. R-43]|uniref:hypothetical protein n=1 Tax=Pseudoduganella sp. R-43 TaxID=3404063 RepID=UPI003CEC2818